jgi:predicted DNA-binding protein
MITQQSQVKINLPLSLKEFLESKASKFGMPIASYVKHLILKDVSDMEYPTFRMSDLAEKKAREAIADRKKAIKISDVAEYFKKL